MHDLTTKLSGGNISDLKRSFLGSQRISQWPRAVFFFSSFFTVD